MDALGYVGWGSGPVIGVSFAYERWRVGAAMQYRVQVTVNPVSGASSFGYPIYLGLYINGVVRTSVTLKAASPSRWTSAIVWTSDWYTVADKTSGTTPVSFNLYSGSGSSRNNTYSYAMAVDPAASTLTVASGTLGQAQTLTLTRYSAAFKDTITWTCGTASGTIAALSQETSFSFTPPMDLAAQAPNAAAVEIRFAVSTYQADGTTLVATSSTTIAAAIPETVKPSCALAVSDPTGSLSAYGAYVQGRSRLHLVVTPTLAYGSEIASYQIVADGKTYTASDVTTDPIAGSGDADADRARDRPTRPHVRRGGRDDHGSAVRGAADLVFHGAKVRRRRHTRRGRFVYQGHVQRGDLPIEQSKYDGIPCPL